MVMGERVALYRSSSEFSPSSTAGVGKRAQDNRRCCLDDGVECPEADQGNIADRDG